MYQLTKTLHLLRPPDTVALPYILNTPSLTSSGSIQS